MISKLKVECGQVNVHRLIKMKEDIADSKLEEQFFKETL